MGSSLELSLPHLRTQKKTGTAISVSEDSVLGLVGMVYDAALDERKWPLFLETFARAVGGDSSLLLSTDDEAGAADFVASVGFDPAWQSAYRQHFVKLDYLTPSLYQFKVGEVRSSDQVFSLSEQRKTEFFNDFTIPQDKVHALGALLIKDGNHSLLFAAQRGKRAGEFGEEEARLLGILAPHVARAVQVHRKISSVTAAKELAFGALDHLRVGVVVTNSLGAPLFFNRAAEGMLSPGNGISIRHDRLALSTPEKTAQLQKLIAGAAQGIHGVACGGDLRIALPHSGGFLHCLVTPVSLEFSARWDVALPSGCVAVFLSKPSGLQLSPERLAVLYEITPAEARLAAMLAACQSVEQAAESLGITVQTARSQLKAVFAKTGVHSQSELLMLLATGTLAHCRNQI